MAPAAAGVFNSAGAGGRRAIEEIRDILQRRPDAGESASTPTAEIEKPPAAARNTLLDKAGVFFR